MKVQSILVVCAGNLCRSPVGQVVLAEHLQQVDVTSAGLVARAGKTACATATQVASECGIDISAHRSTRLTPELVLKNDLVLVMEDMHLREVRAAMPHVQGKVMLFGKWKGEMDIPDPYKRSSEMYKAVFTQIQEHAQYWASKLD